MNRADRRRQAKQFKGQNVMLNPGVEQTDRTNAIWCWMHKLNLDDIDNPTERDKRLIQSTEFKTVKVTEKNGIIKAYKVCPRCHNTVELGEIVKPLLR